MMTTREFIAEMSSIMRLLREHAFLAYSETGINEYERKARECENLFAELVCRKTGITVRALEGTLRIEELKNPSVAGAISAAKKASRRAKEKADGLNGPQSDTYRECCAQWGRAAELLGQGAVKSSEEERE